jgi:TP901 family phage tail tape measure protein
MPLDVTGSKSLYWKASVDPRGVRSGAREIKGIIGTLTRNISATDIFAGVGIGAAVAFGKASRAAYQFSKDFDAAMKEVETISAAVEANFAGMSDRIIELSTDVPEAAGGLAKGLYQVVSAGYDGAEGLQVLETAAKAAIGGVTDTRTAVDGITTAINSFNMGAQGAERAADVLFTTVRLGKTTFGEVSQYIAQAAPTFAAAGGSIEELGAAIATLTAQGTPTAQAVTQIRGSIVALNKVFGDGWTDAMSYQEALQRLYERANGSQTELRKMVPEIEAMNAVLGLAGPNAEKAARALEEHRNAVGAAEEAYKTMADTAERQFTLLQNNVAKKLKPLGDALLSFATGAAKNINALLEGAKSDIEKLEATYENLVSGLSKRKNVLDDVTARFKELSENTRKTKEEAEEYQAVAQTLATILGVELPRGILDVKDANNLLNASLEQSIAIEERMIETRIKLAEIRQKKTEQELVLAQNFRNETARELQEAQKNLDNLAADQRELIEGVMSRISNRNYLDPTPTLIPEELQKLKNLGVEVEGLREKLHSLYEGKLTDVEISELQNEIYQQLIRNSGDYESAIAEVDAKTAIHSAHQEELKARIEGTRDEINLLTQALDNLSKKQEEQGGGGGAGGDFKGRGYSGVSGGILDQTGINRAKTLVEMARGAVGVYAAMLDDQEDLTKGLYTNLADLSDEELENFIDNARKKHDILDDYSNAWLAWEDKIAQAIAEKYERIFEVYRDISSMFESISRFTANFDSGLSEITGQAARLVDQMLAMKQALRESGSVFDQIGAGFGLAGGVFGIIDSLFGQSRSKVNDRLLAQTESMNRLLETQVDLLRRSIGEEVIDNIVSVTNAYREQERAAMDAIESFQLYAKNMRTGETGRTSIGDLLNPQQIKEVVDGTRTLGDVLAEIMQSSNEYYYDFLSNQDKSTLNTLKDQITEAREALLDYRGELRQTLTGTTSESIADAIVEGFAAGNDAAEDFADTFEGLMRKALLDSFQRRILSEAVDDWYGLFADLTEEGGGLDEADIDKLRMTFDMMMDNLGESYEEIQQIMERAGIEADGGADSQGMAGAIRGVTEETAGLLAGQFNAMRMDIKRMVDVMVGSGSDATFRIKNINRLDAILGQAYYLDDIWSEAETSNETLKTIRDYVYYMDDIWQQMQTATNRITEVRDQAYCLDDVWEGVKDIVPKLNHIDDTVLEAIKNRLGVVATNSYYADDILAWAKQGAAESAAINERLADVVYAMNRTMENTAYNKNLVTILSVLKDIRSNTGASGGAAAGGSDIDTMRAIGAPY